MLFMTAQAIQMLRFVGLMVLTTETSSIATQADRKSTRLNSSHQI